MLIMYTEGILWKGKERGCKTNQLTYKCPFSHCGFSDVKVVSTSGCNNVTIMVMHK